MTAYKKALCSDCSKGQEQSVVPAESGEKCFYPNCTVDSKLKDRDACVIWDVRLPLQTIYDMFSPVVKLAIEENTKINREYPSKPLYIYLHSECAAEWGMQLIKDSLNSNNRVGRRLSNREKEWGHYGKE